MAEQEGRPEGGEEEDTVIMYSRQQRFALPGEPICVVCNRFGECILFAYFIYWLYILRTFYFFYLIFYYFIFYFILFNIKYQVTN